jgi:hypothetical protein
MYRYMGRPLLPVSKAQHIVDAVASRLVIDSYVDVDEHVFISSANTILTAMLAEAFVRFFLVAWAVLGAALGGGSKPGSMRSERGAWSTGSGVSAAAASLARFSERREGREIL